MDKVSGSGSYYISGSATTTVTGLTAGTYVFSLKVQITWAQLLQIMSQLLWNGCSKQVADRYTVILEGYDVYHP